MGNVKELFDEYKTSYLFEVAFMFNDAVICVSNDEFLPEVVGAYKQDDEMIYNRIKHKPRRLSWESFEMFEDSLDLVYDCGLEIQYPIYSKDDVNVEAIMVMAKDVNTLNRVSGYIMDSLDKMQDTMSAVGSLERMKSGFVVDAVVGDTRLISPKIIRRSVMLSRSADGVEGVIYAVKEKNDKNRVEVAENE